jgi:hypothetical protein
MQVVSSRTKVLFATAMLLPAGIIIGRLDRLSVIDAARDIGAWGAWVEIGWLTKGILLVGIVSVVAAVVSLLIDRTKARSDQRKSA